MKLVFLLIALVPLVMVAAKSTPGRMAARYDNFAVYKVEIDTDEKMEELKKIHERVTVSL